jgi:hypothetical protein
MNNLNKKNNENLLFKRSIRDLSKKVENTCHQINCTFYEESNGASINNKFTWFLTCKTKEKDKIKTICDECLAQEKEWIMHTKASILAEIILFEDYVFNFELRSKLCVNIPKTIELIKSLKQHLRGLKHTLKLINQIQKIGVINYVCK